MKQAVKPAASRHALTCFHGDKTPFSSSRPFHQRLTEIRLFLPQKTKKMLTEISVAATAAKHQEFTRATVHHTVPSSSQGLWRAEGIHLILWLCCWGLLNNPRGQN